MKKLLRKVVVTAAAVVVAGGGGMGWACVVQTPPKPQEKEIEIEDFGIDSIDGMHNYRIGIDVNKFGQSDTLTCQCGALLGAAPNLGNLPSSVKITEADLKIYSLNAGTGEYEYEYEAPEFESEPFEQDDDLANELQSRQDAIDAESSTAFSVDLDPGNTILGPGEKFRLTFNMKVAQADVAKIVNVPIQFAAGSSSATHPIEFFSGYQNLLTLATLWPSDLNKDGKTDDSDLGIWQQGYGVNATGDINKDGVTDGADFLALQRQYGNLPVAGPLPLTSALSAVPEPNSLLLALGAAGLCLALRRS